MKRLTSCPDRWVARKSPGHPRDLGSKGRALVFGRCATASGQVQQGRDR